MKLKAHILIQLIIFILLYFLIGLNFNITITIVLFHFIPTLDYIMKKANFHKELHRKLFHSVFILIISSILIFHFTSTQIGILSTVNLVLHITMDLKGKGVALFFPVSEYRVRLK